MSAAESAIVYVCMCVCEEGRCRVRRRDVGVCSNAVKGVKMRRKRSGRREEDTTEYECLRRAAADQGKKYSAVCLET